MFTGIIEAQGQIRSIQAHGQDTRMGFEVGAEFMNGVSVGDSIAVNGVCLTAIELGPDHFHADLSAETLGATTAAQWLVDQRVNLEPALTLAKPLGGHLVSGHVDGIGHLRSTAEDARSLRMNFELPAALARYVARKGSITIDGISLTVNAIEGAVFGVNIVPHTLSCTTLGQLQIGQPVNLEVDLIARYLERLLTASEESP